MWTLVFILLILFPHSFTLAYIICTGEAQMLHQNDNTCHTIPDLAYALRAIPWNSASTSADSSTNGRRKLFWFGNQNAPVAYKKALHTPMDCFEDYTGQYVQHNVYTDPYGTQWRTAICSFRGVCNDRGRILTNYTERDEYPGGGLDQKWYPMLDNPCHCLAGWDGIYCTKPLFVYPWNMQEDYTSYGLACDPNSVSMYDVTRIGVSFIQECAAANIPFQLVLFTATGLYANCKFAFGDAAKGMYCRDSSMFCNGRGGQQIWTVASSTYSPGVTVTVLTYFKAYMNNHFTGLPDPKFPMSCFCDGGWTGRECEAPVVPCGNIQCNGLTEDCFVIPAVPPRVAYPVCACKAGYLVDQTSFDCIKAAQLSLLPTINLFTPPSTEQVGYRDIGVTKPSIKWACQIELTTSNRPKFTKVDSRVIQYYDPKPNAPLAFDPTYATGTTQQLTWISYISASCKPEECRTTGSHSRKLFTLQMVQKLCAAPCYASGDACLYLSDNSDCSQYELLRMLPQVYRSSGQPAPCQCDRYYSGDQCDVLALNCEQQGSLGLIRDVDQTLCTCNHNGTLDNSWLSDGLNGCVNSYSRQIVRYDYLQGGVNNPTRSDSDNFQCRLAREPILSFPPGPISTENYGSCRSDYGELCTGHGWIQRRLTMTRDNLGTQAQVIYITKHDVSLFLNIPDNPAQHCQCDATFDGTFCNSQLQPCGFATCFTPQETCHRFFDQQYGVFVQGCICSPGYLLIEPDGDCYKPKLDLAELSTIYVVDELQPQQAIIPCLIDPGVTRLLTNVAFPQNLQSGLCKSVDQCNGRGYRMYLITIPTEWTAGSSVTGIRLDPTQHPARARSSIISFQLCVCDFGWGGSDCEIPMIQCGMLHDARTPINCDGNLFECNPNGIGCRCRREASRPVVAPDLVRYDFGNYAIAATCIAGASNVFSFSLPELGYNCQSGTQGNFRQDGLICRGDNLCNGRGWQYVFLNETVNPRTIVGVLDIHTVSMACICDPGYAGETCQRVLGTCSSSTQINTDRGCTCKPFYFPTTQGECKQVESNIKLQFGYYADREHYDAPWACFLSASLDTSDLYAYKPTGTLLQERIGLCRSAVFCSGHGMKYIRAYFQPSPPDLYDPENEQETAFYHTTTSPVADQSIANAYCICDEDFYGPYCASSYLSNLIDTPASEHTPSCRDTQGRDAACETPSMQCKESGDGCECAPTYYPVVFGDLERVKCVKMNYSRNYAFAWQGQALNCTSPADTPTLNRRYASYCRGLGFCSNHGARWVSLQPGGQLEPWTGQGCQCDYGYTGTSCATQCFRQYPTLPCSTTLDSCQQQGAYRMLPDRPRTCISTDSYRLLDLTVYQWVDRNAARSLVAQLKCQIPRHVILFNGYLPNRRSFKLLCELLPFKGDRDTINTNLVQNRVTGAVSQIISCDNASKPCFSAFYVITSRLNETLPYSSVNLESPKVPQCLSELYYPALDGLNTCAVCPLCNKYEHCDNNGDCVCNFGYYRSGVRCLAVACPPNRYGDQCESLCPTCNDDSICDSGTTGTGVCMCIEPSKKKSATIKLKGLAQLQEPYSRCSTQHCGPNECNGHGVCRSADGSVLEPYCICDSGWTEVYCSVVATNMNETQDCEVSWTQPTNAFYGSSTKVWTILDLTPQQTTRSARIEHLAMSLKQADYYCYRNVTCEGYVFCDASLAACKALRTTVFSTTLATVYLVTFFTTQLPLLHNGYTTDVTRAVRQIDRMTGSNCKNLTLEQSYYRKYHLKDIQQLCTAYNSLPLLRTLGNCTLSAGLTKWVSVHWQVIGHRNRYAPSKSCTLAPGAYNASVALCTEVKLGCFTAGETEGARRFLKGVACMDHGYCGINAAYTPNSDDAFQMYPYQCVCNTFSGMLDSVSINGRPKWFGLNCQYDAGEACANPVGLTTRSRQQICGGHYERCVNKQTWSATTFSVTANVKPVCDCETPMPSLIPYAGTYCDVSRCSSVFGNDLGGCIRSGVNAGVCVSQNGVWKCQCATGYTGSDCTIAATPCLLNGIQCSGRGVCSSIPARCTCDSGFRGAQCQHSDCTSEIIVTGHGVCEDNILSSCYPVYQGARCEQDVCALSGGMIANDHTCSCPAGTTAFYSASGDPSCWPTCGQTCLNGNCTRTQNGVERQATCSCPPGTVYNEKEGRCASVCLNGGTVGPGWTLATSDCLCVGPWKGRFCEVSRCGFREQVVNGVCVCLRPFTGVGCVLDTCGPFGKGTCYVGGKQAGQCGCDCAPPTSSLTQYDCARHQCGPYGSPKIVLGALTTTSIDNSAIRSLCECQEGFFTSRTSCPGELSGCIFCNDR